MGWNGTQIDGIVCTKRYGVERERDLLPRSLEGDMREVVQRDGGGERERIARIAGKNRTIMMGLQ